MYSGSYIGLALMRGAEGKYLGRGLSVKEGNIERKSSRLVKLSLKLEIVNQIIYREACVQRSINYTILYIKEK